MLVNAGGQPLRGKTLGVAQLREGAHVALRADACDACDACMSSLDPSRPLASSPITPADISPCRGCSQDIGDAFDDAMCWRIPRDRPAAIEFLGLFVAVPVPLLPNFKLLLCARCIDPRR
jgi:hypothetical protein